jgi:hypothetical protein
MKNGKTLTAPPLELAPPPKDGVPAELRLKAGNPVQNGCRSLSAPYAVRWNPCQSRFQSPPNPPGAATAARAQDADRASL